MKNPFGSRKIPIGLQVEPFPERVLHETPKKSGTKYGSPMGTTEEPFWNPFGTLFFLRVYNVVDQRTSVDLIGLEQRLLQTSVNVYRAMARLLEQK